MITSQRFVMNRSTKESLQGFKATDENFSNEMINPIKLNALTNVE